MAREHRPTGNEIREKAKAAKLDHSRTGTGEKGGKKAKLTPARLDHVHTREDLEDGEVVGLLETEIPGDRAGLPPGTYNVFIANVGGDWHVYAEANGEIAAEAVSVTERKDTPKDMKPKFSEGSFCWWVWLVFTGFQWCF
jgi:hypothetical protein